MVGRGERPACEQAFEVAGVLGEAARVGGVHGHDPQRAGAHHLRRGDPELLFELDGEAFLGGDCAAERTRGQRL